jgi:O-phosphoseryl-tRNA(Cys) synthetase
MGDQVMAFVQVIEFRTTDIDAARRVDEEWRRATENKRTVRREMLARDHSDPDRYFAIVFFDSYESAMENSSLPETQAAAEQYQKLAHGPAVFYDLDVLEDLA